MLYTAHSSHCYLHFFKYFKSYCKYFKFCIFWSIFAIFWHLFAHSAWIETNWHNLNFEQTEYNLHITLASFISLVHQPLGQLQGQALQASSCGCWAQETGTRGIADNKDLLSATISWRSSSAAPNFVSCWGRLVFPVQMKGCIHFPLCEQFEILCHSLDTF